MFKLGRSPLRTAVVAVTAVAAVTMGTSVVAVPASQAATPPTVVKVAEGHHTGFDRITFTFIHGLPAQRSAAYVPVLIQDGSGKPIPIEGHAILRVRFFSGTTSVTATQSPHLPEIRQVKLAGNFEGVVSYGIGVTAPEPVTLHTLPGPGAGLNRVYFDVKTP